MDAGMPPQPASAMPVKGREIAGSIPRRRYGFVVRAPVS
jgi:hypothetical protein